MAEVHANGLAMHVQRLGAGTPQVVFVHGLVMDNLSSWYFTVANRVAAHRPVLLYDLRGHGRSARPESGYHLDGLLDDLSALLDAEQAGLVHLVGNSFGGLLALAFALTRPERVAGLVLVDALLPEPGWGERMARTLSLQGGARDAHIASAFQDWLGRHSSRKRTRLADQARALVDGTSLLADVAGSRGWDDDAYEAIACPVLALYGADSDVRAQGERLAARVAGCTLEILPGTHSVLWEQTERVCDHVVAWLS